MAAKDIVHKIQQSPTVFIVKASFSASKMEVFLQKVKNGKIAIEMLHNDLQVVRHFKIYVMSHSFLIDKWNNITFNILNIYK